NKEEKKKFEKKYGRIIEVSAPNSGITPVTIIGGVGSNDITMIAPAPVAGVIVDADKSYLITGNEDIVVTVTKNTTQAQLDEFVKQMKSKGVKLEFENVEFDNGKIVMLSGSMKADGSESNFTVNAFE